MAITNTALATKVNDLLGKWLNREREMQDWISGAAGGGANSDGKFPLTDPLGDTRYTKSPAQLEDDVSGLVSSADASATAAAGSASAAAASETAAASSATAAETHKDSSAQSVVDAQSAQSAAENAEANALASRNLAKQYRDKSLAWAETAFQTEVETGKYSALHWATVAEGFAGSVDSSLYPQIAQNETITGDWKFRAATGNTLFQIHKNASTSQAGLQFYNELGAVRWSFNVTGSTDDDFFIARWNDVGAFVDVPFRIYTYDGRTEFANAVDVGGALTQGGVAVSLSGHAHAWSEITGKPATFTPSAHTHSYLPLAGGNLTGDLLLNSKVTFRASDGVIYPNSDGLVNLGGAGNEWQAVYAQNFYEGEVLLAAKYAPTTPDFERYTQRVTVPGGGAITEIKDENGNSFTASDNHELLVRAYLPVTGTNTGIIGRFYADGGAWVVQTFYASGGSSNHPRLGLTAGGLPGVGHYHASAYDVAVEIVKTNNMTTFGDYYALMSESKINEWNTAYGWGDHAAAGYAAASHSHNYFPRYTINVTGGNLDIIDDPSENGWYAWTGTEPVTGSPGWSYGVVLAVEDGAQMIQLAFGSSGSGKLAVRRNDSGSYYPWTEFWSEANFDPASKADVSHAHSADDITSGELPVTRLQRAGSGDAVVISDGRLAEAADLNTLTDSRIHGLRSNTHVNNPPASVDSWGTLLCLRNSDTGSQLALPRASGSRLAHRGWSSSGGAWSGWREIANVEDLAAYLPLAGGTLTSTLSINSTTSGDTLLRFVTDRPWQFTQLGDDASCHLQLYAESGGKNFIIGSAADANAFTFYPDGGHFYAHGSLRPGLNGSYIEDTGSTHGTINLGGQAKGGYYGIALANHVNLMSNGSSVCGLYNNTDSDWWMVCRDNAEVELYYNGGLAFETQSYGARVYGGRLDLDNATSSTYDVRLTSNYDFDGMFQVQDGAGVAWLTVGRDGEAHVGAPAAGKAILHYKAQTGYNSGGISVGTTAPVSPSKGDIWIDTN